MPRILRLTLLLALAAAAPAALQAAPVETEADGGPAAEAAQAAPAHRTAPASPSRSAADGGAAPKAEAAPVPNAPVAAPAPEVRVDRPRLAPCGAPPSMGALPFDPGERLAYDVDVMGVRAGELTLGVHRHGADGLAFEARARTNTFFENVRKMQGRATSYSRREDLRPLRYREDATEDGVRKWAEVLFSPERKEVAVHYRIGERERHSRWPVHTGPHDLLSLVYWIRTLDLAPGREICMDVYGNRKVWRVRGRVDAEEWVDTPAGKFKTWRLKATARRLDMPDRAKDLYAWISQDARRLPVAAVGEIDLGPVRALLKRDGDGPERSRPNYGGGRW